MLIFKILDAAQWEEAKQAGRFHGSAADVRDGFIHFSTGAQVRATAEKHFEGKTNLVLVAVEAEALGSELKWEPSRGGALFPHLYAPLLPSLAVWVQHLGFENGRHLLPPGLSKRG